MPYDLATRLHHGKLKCKHPSKQLRSDLHCEDASTDDNDALVDTAQSDAPLLTEVPCTASKALL